MIKARYKIILMFVLLMVAFIFIMADAMERENEVTIVNEMDSELSVLPKESGVFKRGSDGLDYEKMPINVASRRTLKAYYKNRAYPGAPPVIPHALLDEQGIGGKNCLQCHQNGGYVKKFKAYAPITPHADYLNCKQCHVPAKVSSRFKSSDWRKISHPEIHNTALQTSPPTIPHMLQLRENCLACHAGPAAPKEILVSHPERVNCRQCHALKGNTALVKWDSVPDVVRKIEWEKLGQ